jgi:tRNA 2-selenouridine synthase
MISPVSSKINIEKFLELAEEYTVADVRSPSEYNHGHIPGAINIPLFDDQERKTVGIKYKKEGRSKAIIRGLELSGPSMHLKLSEALIVAGKGKILVHCWRGGMRSEAMAWLFSLGDIDTEILEGGYKSYRHHILKRLSEKRKMILLGGMTGSSKTHILHFLKKQNQQVIDLEGLANHRGSAFGSLGLPPQPTSEHFANLLFDEWKRIDSDVPLWVEDESKNIGTVFMPDSFYNNMQETHAVILLMDLKTRLPGLIREYSNYPPDLLKGAVMKISKRLGMDNTREAIGAIESGDFAKAIEITLRYYDKTYMFGIKRKQTRDILFVSTDTDDIETNALKVLEAAHKIIW